MGMNFYAINDQGERYHIGKSSSGWEFHFEAHPELGVYSSTQWLIKTSFARLRYYTEGE